MLREFKAAFEDAIQNNVGNSDKIDIIFENFTYNSIPGKPFINVWFMFAKTQNPTILAPSEAEQILETGYVQLNLQFPLNGGPGPCDAVAQSIRSTFRRGLAFTLSTGVLIVQTTPSVSPGRIEGDRWFVPVKIYFFANLFE